MIVEFTSIYSGETEKLSPVFNQYEQNVTTRLDFIDHEGMPYITLSTNLSLPLDLTADIICIEDDGSHLALAKRLVDLGCLVRLNVDAVQSGYKTYSAYVIVGELLTELRKQLPEGGM